jgi:DEAD/DEAH box helicase domain-containing protein
VTFRDVNFGELAKPGDAFKVADKEAQRPGFRCAATAARCRSPHVAAQERREQTHSFDCPKHGSDDPANLLNCLYLYREFESEALRILVPYTKNGVDERVVQSFMAAVQLGLKRRYGGKVDHLRMVLQDEPGKDGGPRKHYVMLYDSVPGGTGYLHQLLAHDAKNAGRCAAHGTGGADPLCLQLPGPGEGRLLPLSVPVPAGTQHGAGVTRQRQGGADGFGRPR